MNREEYIKSRDEALRNAAIAEQTARDRVISRYIEFERRINSESNVLAPNGISIAASESGTVKSASLASAESLAVNDSNGKPTSLADAMNLNRKIVKGNNHE